MRRVRVCFGGAAVLLFCTGMAALDDPPSLGSAASFAVLGATSVQSSGPSRVAGNLGVGPGNALSGFPPGTVTLGEVFRAGAMTQAAQKDLAATLRDLAGRACTKTPAGLSGTTLAAGVICFPSDAALSGTLTLDAAGHSDALWIIRIGGTLTTAAEASVVVINGPQRANIYWQVAGSAILGSGTTFLGNLLAQGNITFGAGASLSGRALSQAGAVTLDTNDVSLCCDPIRLSSPSLPDGTLQTEYSATTLVASGGTGPYRFERVAGTLPTGLSLSAAGTISGTPTVPGRFLFAIQVTDSLNCTRVRPYAINVCPVITVSALPVNAWPSCVPFNHQFTASGGSGSYRFRPGGTLPPGLSLPETGLLSGTPTIPGTYVFPVVAADRANECEGTRVVTLEVSCPATTITPEVLPEGFVGEPYRVVFAAAGLCSPYSLSTIGPLPDGLLPLTSDGVLAGTPTKEGSFPITVRAFDPRSTCFAEKTYTLQIHCADIKILPATLPNGMVGIPYSQLLSATGGTAPHTIAFADRGSLPAEFSIIANTLSATTPPPLTAGFYGFTLRATDALGCTSADAHYDLAICPLTLSPSMLPDATVGSGYSEQIFVSGGSGHYEFSHSGGTLPPPLTVDTTTGKIVGTPSMPGIYHFTVTARDTVTNCTGSVNITIHVVCPDLVIGPPVLPPGTVGTFYEQAIVAAGGTPPYAFTIVSGALPPGLTLSGDGTISGTPTASGTFSVTFRFTGAGDCGGDIFYCTFDISPAGCPPGTTITLSPAVLPHAATGIPYSHFITAAGGTASYTFIVSAGALPPGLSLDPLTGEISGIPAAAGSYDFTVTATDANGCLGSACYTIEVSVTIPALSGWALFVLCALLAAIAIRRMLD